MSRSSFRAGAGALLLCVGVVLGWGLSDTRAPGTDHEAALEKLTKAYETIRSEYVDPVASDTLSTRALRGMVSSLDPHSTYIGPQRMDRIQETFEGSFEGIGISYELIEGPREKPEQDTIFVATVVPGGPSEEAGLRPGDRIVGVEGESAVGWTSTRIRSRLTGSEGTEVRVEVRRPTRPSTFHTTIVRDHVPLRTLEAAYMMNDTTGYVRIRRFAQPTHRELTDALDRLTEAGLRRLILDLRGNAGGLMAGAEKVADEFLVEDQLIVSARSEHNDYRDTRDATSGGAFEEGALIVLVDEQSASASEIVAGALQDHDRALIVGRRTYGKGLVQRQFNFDDESGLRLTIARFYTPSGRLIQRPYDTASHGGASRASPSSANRADSMTYRTDAGRVVKGGGGIQPDVLVEQEGEGGTYRDAVERRGLVHSFARTWIDARAESLRARWAGRPDAFAAAFDLPGSVVPAFLQYAESHGVPMPPQGPDGPSLAGEQSRGGVGSESPAFRRGDATRRVLDTLIASYVGRRLFGTSMLIRLRNTIDPVVAKAQASWAKAEALAARYPVE